MTARSLKYLVLIAAAPLFLAACGDGWEMIRTTEMFPYGNQRTAGSGVAYVRANMLPKKELKLGPAQQEAPVVMQKIEEPVPSPAEVPAEETGETDKAMEELFEKSLQK